MQFRGLAIGGGGRLGLSLVWCGRNRYLCSHRGKGVMWRPRVHLIARMCDIISCESRQGIFPALCIHRKHVTSVCSRLGVSRVGGARMQSPMSCVREDDMWF
jgi:hypothetical protein